MVRRAAWTWVAMMPIAITNGIFREVALKPVLGDQIARQVSVATGSIAFLVLVYFMMREYVVDETDRRLLNIGLTWLAATIVFEFGFGQADAVDALIRSSRLIFVAIHKDLQGIPRVAVATV